LLYLFFCRYWRCLHRSDKCTGRLQTTPLLNDGQTPTLLVGPNEHNHQPNDAELVRSCAISDLRKTVKSVPLQPLKVSYDAIISEQTSNQADVALLPSYQSVESILKLQRSDDIPRLPQTRQDIVLEGPWAQTVEGNRFLISAPSVADNEMIVFASDASLLRLASCDTIYMDGTFRVAPSLYTQLYTIHGLCSNFVVPLVYVFMIDKSSASYYKLFDIIRQAVFELGAAWNPQTVVSDFESGLIEAVRVQFPNALHSGCHFHFTQAIIRKMKEVGLYCAYRDTTRYPEIGEFIQMSMALAFVPDTEVQRQFEGLVANLNDVHKCMLERFITYFDETWVDGVFSLKMWNKYGQDYLHRTNNRVESWHSTLNQKLPSAHPNIFTVIKVLKSCEAGTQKTLLGQADIGESPPKRRQKYIKLEKNLKKAHALHQAGTLTTNELLRRVRHCIRKVD